MKRFLAMTLALVLMLCCLTGCGANKNDDTVMTVNGLAVSYDEYVFWIGYASMYLSYQYSYYGMEVEWLTEQSDGSTNASWCVDYGYETVLQKAIIDSKCAELGITLSDEDEQSVQESLDDYKVQCCGEDATDEQFEEYLKTNQYSNLKVLRSSQVTTVLTNKLFTELYGENGEKIGDDELLSMAAEEGYTKANHILFQFTDEESNDRSESEIAAGKAKLEGFMAELNAIEDPEERYARFLELKADNCENSGTEAYEFGANTMVSEFYDASLALQPYELTIVETSYGYHLMIGLPLDLDYTVTSSSSSSTTLRDTMLNSMFIDDLTQWEEEAVVEKVGEFEDYDFSSMFSESGFVYQSWADRTGSSNKGDGNTALYIVSGVAVLAIGVVIYLLVSKSKAKKQPDTATKKQSEEKIEEQPVEEAAEPVEEPAEEAAEEPAEETEKPETEE